MKKALCLCFAVMAALFLASCDDGGKPDDTTAAQIKTDWRNSIEYEGSFSVNSTTKLLYSLDRGTVTLWDDGGDGSILQTLKYDSSAPDAMERIEHLDVNGDGSSDLRIIYDEANGSRYNLWVWNKSKGQYDACSIYKDICNPEAGENGTVLETIDKGFFGRVKKVYGFDERLTLTEISSELTGAEDTAKRIAEAFSLDKIAPTEGGVTIEMKECTAFAASDTQGASAAYLAYDSEGNWYVDMGMLGFYRVVEYDEASDTISSGDYTGESGTAQMLAEKTYGGRLNIMSKSTGSMGGVDATRYYILNGATPCCYVVITKNGPCYISSTDENYSRINKSTAAIEDSVSEKFVLKEAN